MNTTINQDINIKKTQILIPRKKSKSIKFALTLLLSSLLILVVILLHFIELDFVKVTKKLPLFVIIMFIIIEPFLLFSFGFYFKQIFNNKPVLIVNDIGIDVQMSFNPVGLIKWNDINNVLSIPYLDNTYYICIFLSNPHKYIKNKKTLNSKNTDKWGHIRFTSLYFKKEYKDVMDLISYYLQKSKEDFI